MCIAVSGDGNYVNYVLDSIKKAAYTAKYIHCVRAHLFSVFLFGEGLYSTQLS